MMTGIPVVSIGPAWMKGTPYGPLLFEGHILTGYGYNDPYDARSVLMELLANPNFAADLSAQQREVMKDFTREAVGESWRSFLGTTTKPALVPSATESSSGAPPEPTASTAGG
jgi:hypothetical protein